MNIRSALRTSFASCLTVNSSGANVQTSQVVSAMLGLAAPVAIGAMLGHARIGMVASLGGLVLSTAGHGESFREQIPGLIYAVVAGTLAMLVGLSFCGHGALSIFAIVGVAGVAAFFGSISRPLARATTQFTIFAIIAANFGPGADHPLGIMLLFFLGATLTAGLSLALRPLFQALNIDRLSPGRVAGPPKKYTARELLRRWRKSLLHLSGWQYTLRITLCLLAAQGFGLLWPRHRGYWALITVMIVVRRDLQAALERTFERATGTLIGVLLVGLLLLGLSSDWVLVAAIAALAAARPVLMETSYTAYAAVQTPLVLLLLEFGRRPSPGVVFDRLVATLAGCILALIFGFVGWHKLSPSTPIRGTG